MNLVLLVIILTVAASCYRRDMCEIALLVPGSPFYDCSVTLQKRYFKHGNLKFTIFIKHDQPSLSTSVGTNENLETVSAAVSKILCDL